VPKLPNTVDSPMYDNIMISYNRPGEGSVRQFGFFRPYFRVLAGIFPYFTNKSRDLTKKKGSVRQYPPRVYRGINLGHS